MSLLNPVLLPPKVKAYLSQGERFIKWDDETSIASPVILRVDPKGYYLYWTHQSKVRHYPTWPSTPTASMNSARPLVVQDGDMDAGDAGSVAPGALWAGREDAVTS